MSPSTPGRREPTRPTPIPITSPLCEVCQQARPTTFGALPELDIKAARCLECEEAGAVPWWILVQHTHDMGGSLNAPEKWQDVIRNTLRLLNINEAAFELALSQHGRGPSAQSARP